jgi:hypothetical protein
VAADDGAGRGVAAVLSVRQMILDIIGYLLAYRRQLKHLVFDNRIVGLFGKFPIHHRLVPVDSRLVPSRTDTDELGVVPI